MALKSGSEGTSTKEIEELLDGVDQTLDRLKTMYEQYFLGIQKQAPAFLHNDVERKLRDLTQMNMRNTRLRFRLATLQQKFGSYNSYWRRTLRQIENGTYVRNLAKIGREAAQKGADIPEEILAAMPKRMREQVLRDRDAAIAIAKRRNQIDEPAEGMEPPDVDDVAAMISEPSILKRELKTQTGAHVLSEDEGDLDFDKLFSAFEDDAPKEVAPKPTAQAQQMTRPTVRPSQAESDDTDPGFAFDLDAAQQEAARPTPNVPKAPPATTRQPPPQHPVLRQTGPVPLPAVNTATSAIPKPLAPSQASRPNPIAPGASLRTGPVAVESMSGPFPRAQTAEPSTTSDPSPTPEPSPTPPSRQSSPAMPSPTPPSRQSSPAMPTTTPPSRQSSPAMPTTTPRAQTPDPSTTHAGAPPARPTPDQLAGTPPTGPTPIPQVPRPAPPNAPTQAIPKAAATPAAATPAPQDAPPNAPTQAMPKAAATPPGATQAMPKPTATLTGATQAMPKAAATPPGATQAMPKPTATPPGATQAMPKAAATPPGATQAMPKAAPPNAPTQAMPKAAATPPGATQAMPKPAATPPAPTPTVSKVPPNAPTQAMPKGAPPNAPTQAAPPNAPTQAIPRTAPPTAPTQAKPPQTQPVPRPTPNVPKPPAAPPLKPPPGMTDADVNALHAKYIQAKQMVGEKVDAGSREKLLRTINQTAPKIMEQYKASGVDFSVVVKDNQVVIKAKPKT